MDPRKRGCSTLSGWWFGTFSTFPYLRKNHPYSLSYFSEGLKSPSQYGIWWDVLEMLWDFLGFAWDFQPTSFNIVQPTSWFLGDMFTSKLDASRGGVRFLRLVAVLLGGGCFVAPQLSGQPRRQDLRDPTGRVEVSNCLVVSNMFFLFSISYLGCHPYKIDELLIFFKMGAPATRQRMGFQWISVMILGNWGKTIGVRRGILMIHVKAVRMRSEEGFNRSTTCSRNFSPSTSCQHPWSKKGLRHCSNVLKTGIWSTKSGWTWGFDPFLTVHAACQGICQHMLPSGKLT